MFITKFDAMDSTINENQQQQQQYSVGYGCEFQLPSNSQFSCNFPSSLDVRSAYVYLYNGAYIYGIEYGFGVTNVTVEFINLD